jgi:hypothetical protein
MQKSHTTRFRIAAALAAACVGLAVASTASAVDLRSWDMKINDATKRFIVLPAFSNQAVLDKETQLVWERTPNNAYTHFDGALVVCLSNARGGRKGWRLPTAAELLSLQGVGAQTLPDGHPFQYLSSGNYWTATSQPINDSLAITVNMKIFNIAAGAKYSANAYTWCVRGPGQ